MTLLLIDCPTGLAGNMLLAGLLDLGVPEQVVHGALADLGLEGRYRLQLETRRSHGLRGLHLAVESLEADPPHRAWGDLRQRIAGSALAADLRERVLAVFGLLAEAEAAVHGEPLEAVHFHEVGALDALVDVVGVCAALRELGVEEVICAVPPAGHGSVSTAHGPLPLPAPAVLEIARSRSIPLRSSEGFPAGELTTPTGLALAACWATRFGVMPTAVPLRLGVGLGSRSLDRPNLLRLCLARPLLAGPAEAPEAAEEAGGDGESAEPLLEQQAQIDDASAEDLAFLAGALRQAGAVEVFSQTALMKKGRAGTLITALLPPALAPALRNVWWRHSGSMGVRETLQRRWRLPRRLERLSTELGTVGLRWVDLPDGRRRMKAEHDDLASLARLHGLEIAQVRQRVAEALARREAAGDERP
ncbi:MAG: LarC family nickel insertion protein [Cyanobium sp.]